MGWIVILEDLTKDMPVIEGISAPHRGRQRQLLFNKQLSTCSCKQANIFLKALDPDEQPQIHHYEKETKDSVCILALPVTSAALGRCVNISGFPFPLLEKEVT